ncbi:MAG: hypothetical protein ABIQ11_06095 [Saprospiraceae bacterium]
MRKQTGLEDFIRDHRSDFDDLKAPPGVWNRINGEKTKVHSLWKWSAVAASALLMLSLGYILGTNAQKEPARAEWQEYQETEQYYESRIQEKMEQIKTLPVREEVMTDIRVLDEVYLQLKAQLLEDPNADAEVLLSAMIRHQQQKLEVMEEILNRVDKYQSNEKEVIEM